MITAEAVHAACHGEHQEGGEHRGQQAPLLQRFDEGVAREGKAIVLALVVDADQHRAAVFDLEQQRHAPQLGRHAPEQHRAAAAAAAAPAAQALAQAGHVPAGTLAVQQRQHRRAGVAVQQDTRGEAAILAQVAQQQPGADLLELQADHARIRRSGEQALPHPGVENGRLLRVPGQRQQPLVTVLLGEQVAGHDRRVLADLAPIEQLAHGVHGAGRCATVDGIGDAHQLAAHAVGEHRQAPWNCRQRQPGTVVDEHPHGVGQVVQRHRAAGEHGHGARRASVRQAPAREQQAPLHRLREEVDAVVVGGEHRRLCLELDAQQRRRLAAEQAGAGLAGRLQEVLA